MIAESLIFTSYKYNLRIIFKGPSNFMIKAHGMHLIWPLNNFCTMQSLIVKVTHDMSQCLWELLIKYLSPFL